jgi:hypothetical protein
MSTGLGVVSIVVADGIARKCEYISMNLSAQLKSPHLGMVGILTAGNEHFFRHVDTIQQQTGISFNLRIVDPLEWT